MRTACFAKRTNLAFTETETEGGRGALPSPPLHLFHSFFFSGCCIYDNNSTCVTLRKLVHLLYVFCWFTSYAARQMQGMDWRVFLSSWIAFKFPALCWDENFLKAWSLFNPISLLFLIFNPTSLLFFIMWLIWVLLIMLQSLLVCYAIKMNTKVRTKLQNMKAPMKHDKVITVINFNQCPSFYLFFWKTVCFLSLSLCCFIFSL